ncbi:hypothetical protein C0J52_01663 [Blattella germanica]|nr:hypothetical protein C0J52_01663 [Blattella germanica]
MMEKLGAPQTHLGLKAMIKEVDEDGDNKISFREIEELKKTSKFEDEIRQEQEQRKREEEEKTQRRIAFKQKAALFQNGSQETNDST